MIGRERDIKLSEMLKEIHEQPKAVQDTLNSVLKDGAIDLSSVGLTEEELQSFSQIYIVACHDHTFCGLCGKSG